MRAKVKTLIQRKVVLQLFSPPNDDKQSGDIMTCKVILGIMLQFRIWHKMNRMVTVPLAESSQVLTNLV